MIGKTLAHYEILAPLGVGGMGEVYRARDTKLDRDVAIKLLPEELAADPGRVARLEREAKLLAALNHPRVAAIYSLEEAGGSRFLVLELVEGESLQERLRGGPLPVSTALDCGRQIADALGAAHERGIIHRDLKPANVLITPEGRIKVLDFGIARFESREAPLGQTAKQTELTADGAVIGTAPYMSPEQVRGAIADQRSDIWSFGCLLFEMLTGRRAFERETVADTLAAILAEEPDWKLLPPRLPSSVEALVRRCLRKDVDRRLHHIADARIEIEDTTGSGGGFAGAGTAAGAAREPRTGRLVRARWTAGARVRWLLAAAAGATAVAAGAYLWLGADGSRGPDSWNIRQITRSPAIEIQPSLDPAGRFIVYTSNESGNLDIYWQLVDGQNRQNLTEASLADDLQPAVSPDGRSIAFRSDRDVGGLYVMGAFGDNPRRLTTRGYDPAWTPDGEWIVFSDLGIITPTNTIPGGLAKVEVADPSNIVELHPSGYLPAVSPNGHRIAFFDRVEGGSREIYTIAASGGDPLRVTDDDALDWAPSWAPDGHRLYFSSDRGGVSNIWYVEIDESSGEPRGEPRRAGTSEAEQGWPAVAGDGRSIAYVARREPRNLQRVAFDPETRQVIGSPESITSGANSASRFDLSPDGEWIVYADLDRNMFLISADGSGERRQLSESQYRSYGPRFSPEGRQIAFGSDISGQPEIWSIDISSGDLTQLTHAGGAEFVQDPVFSPDGSMLMFRVSEGVDYTNYLLALDRPWDEQTLVELPQPEDNSFQPSYWSPDGSAIVGWTSGFEPDARFLLLEVASRTYQEVSDFRGHAHPAWLGDDYLVFAASASTRNVAVRREELLLMHRATGETESLMGDGLDWTFEEQVVVSPDGRWIYFIRTGLDADIWMLTGSS